MALIMGNGSNYHHYPSPNHQVLLSFRAIMAAFYHAPPLHRTPVPALRFPLKLFSGELLRIFLFYFYVFNHFFYLLIYYFLQLHCLIYHTSAVSLSSDIQLNYFFSFLVTLFYQSAVSLTLETIQWNYHDLLIVIFVII